MSAQQANTPQISSQNLGGAAARRAPSFSFVNGAIIGGLLFFGPSLTWWQWVLLGSFGFVAMLYFRQEKMLYACTPPNMPQTPPENPVGWQNPKQQTMNYEDVEILTEDGCKLHAWFIYQPDRYQRPTLVYFHGNAGNVGFRLPLLKELFYRTKVNILAVDYRGYGQSTGKPSEKGLNTDADAVLNYVLERKDINSKKICIFGRSLGGAVAVSLCSRRTKDIAGLIIENTYISMQELAKDLFSILKLVGPLLPMLLKNKWDTREKIKSVDCPILFISGLQDQVIPSRHMKTLFDSAPDNPLNVYKPMLGGHNDTPLKNPHRYYETFNDFLSSLDKSGK